MKKKGVTPKSSAIVYCSVDDTLTLTLSVNGPLILLYFEETYVILQLQCAINHVHIITTRKNVICGLYFYTLLND